MTAGVCLSQQNNSIGYEQILIKCSGNVNEWLFILFFLMFGDL